MVLKAARAKVEVERNLTNALLGPAQVVHVALEFDCDVLGALMREL
jgi:hypothetical protein